VLGHDHVYLCFDLPNHGRSSGTPLGARWTLENYMLTVKRVADYVRWTEPFVCVGHSMGGQICTLFAAVYSDAVKRLVILDTAGPVDMHPEDVVPVKRRALDELLMLENRAWDGTSAPPVYGGSRAALDRIKRRLYTLSAEMLTDESAKMLMDRYYRQLPGDGFSVANDARLRVTYTELFSAAQHRDVVEHVRCPTLLIRATSSNELFDDIYAVFVRLYSRNPNIRTVVVDGNHDVHMNHPHRVAPFVNRFLQNMMSSKL